MTDFNRRDIQRDILYEFISGIPEEFFGDGWLNAMIEEYRCLPTLLRKYLNTDWGVLRECCNIIGVNKQTLLSCIDNINNYEVLKIRMLCKKYNVDIDVVFKCYFKRVGDPE